MCKYACTLAGVTNKILRNFAVNICLLLIQNSMQQ